MLEISNTSLESVGFINSELLIILLDEVSIASLDWRTLVGKIWFKVGAAMYNIVYCTVQYSIMDLFDRPTEVVRANAITPR